MRRTRPKARLAKYQVSVLVVGDDGATTEFRIRPFGGATSGGAWRLTRVAHGKLTSQHLEVRRHPIDGSLECECLSWRRWRRCCHVELVALLAQGTAEVVVIEGDE